MSVCVFVLAYNILNQAFLFQYMIIISWMRMKSDECRMLKDYALQFNDMYDWCACKGKPIPNRIHTVLDVSMGCCRWSMSFQDMKIVQRSAYFIIIYSWCASVPDSFGRFTRITDVWMCSNQICIWKLIIKHRISKGLWRIHILSILVIKMEKKITLLVAKAHTKTRALPSFLE